MCDGPSATSDLYIQIREHGRLRTHEETHMHLEYVFFAYCGTHETYFEYVARHSGKSEEFEVRMVFFTYMKASASKKKKVAKLYWAVLFRCCDSRFIK